MMMDTEDIHIIPQNHAQDKDDDNISIKSHD